MKLPSSGAVTTTRVTPYATITVVHLAVDGVPLCHTTSRITGGYGTADAVLSGILAGDLPCETCGDVFRARARHAAVSIVAEGQTFDMVPVDQALPGADERDVIRPAGTPDEPHPRPWFCNGCQSAFQTGGRCDRCGWPRPT